MDHERPDELRLTPSNLRTAMLFAAMVVWLVLGLSRYMSVGGLLWMGLTLVGLTGTLVYGLMLLPGSSYLEATETGMTVCTAFRKRFYPWMEIKTFFVETMLTRPVVKYSVIIEGDADEGDSDNVSQAYLREETLPDTYGMSPAALADELNRFRRRYTLHKR